MKKGFLFFFVGMFFSGGLFQFDIDLPSFHANQLLKQKEKVAKTKIAVRKQRATLSKKALKKAGKQVAGSLIPIVGGMITLGLAAEHYCEDLKGNIDLQNILNDNDEAFDFAKCLKEVNKDLKSAM